jgi:hypothetical protein
MVVSGESGRQAFFAAKGLHLTEGFKILSGAVRTLPENPFYLNALSLTNNHCRHF